MGRIGKKEFMITQAKYFKSFPQRADKISYVYLNCKTHGKYGMFSFKLSFVSREQRQELSQCAERILNESATAIKETFTELNCILQGFRLYFV